MIEFVCEDAVAWLDNLEPGSLDAIVCSPPYADARGDDYPCVPVAEYGEWTLRWTSSALEAVTPGGSLMLNLGRLWRGGEVSHYHLDALDAALAVGWHWIEELMWIKPNANPIQGRFLTNAHEPVWWLCSTITPAYHGEDDLRRPYAPGTAERYERGYRRNTGVKGQHSGRGRTLNPKGARPQSVRSHYTGREKGNPHPAPAPLDLVRDLVLLSTPPGGIVGCPFMGSGTVAVAAVETGRSFLGCDIDPQCIEWTRDRLNSVLASPEEGGET